MVAQRSLKTAPKMRRTQLMVLTGAPMEVYQLASHAIRVAYRLIFVMRRCHLRAVPTDTMGSPTKAFPAAVI
jgi:hypothetical protein